MLPAALKIVIGSWLLVIGVFFFSSTAFAQPTNSGSGGTAVSAENYKAPQNADYTGLNILHSMTCGIGGFDPNIPDSKLSKCLGYGDGGKLQAYSRLPNGGALGGVNTVMVAMFNTPVISTGYYLADVAKGFGIVPQASAQTVDVPGVGSAVLQPVLKLWQVSRNIAYVSFIVVFLAVGFMIMFRRKINPQTVIGIQQALPGLVIGLLLVTFSYFISSLIVDTSFVSMRLVGTFFQSAQLQNRADVCQLTGAPPPGGQSAAQELASALGSCNQDNYEQLAENANVFGLFGSFVKLGSFFDLIGSIASLFATAIPKEAASGTGGTALVTLIAPGIGPIIGGMLSSGTISIPGVGGASELLGRFLAGSVGGAIGIVVTVIILVALLIQMLRLVWGLIQAYLTILIVTIAAPFIILASSIPGRGGMLSMWWKTLLANVLIFPAVFGAFLFAGAILGNADGFNATMPLFVGINVAIVKIILGFGIVLGTPGIPAAVKNAMGVKDLREVAGAAMEGFNAGRSATIGATRQAYGRTMENFGLNRIQQEEQRRAAGNRRSDLYALVGRNDPIKGEETVRKILRKPFVPRGS